MSRGFEYLVKDPGTRQAFREIWDAVGSGSGNVVVSADSVFSAIVNANFKRATKEWLKADVGQSSWALESNDEGDYIRVLRSAPGTRLITWVEQTRFRQGSQRLTENLDFATDNLYDIGAAGANRPRNLYLAGFLRFGADVNLQRGAADRLDILDAVRLTGKLDWASDGTVDIGAAGANRPRDLYLAESIFFGADVEAVRGAANRLDLLDALRLTGILDFTLDNTHDIGTLVSTFSDDFNRADSAAVGASWIEVEAPNANAFQILSNTLYQRSMAWRGFIYWNDTTPDDQASQATISVITGSPLGGPAVRIDTAGSAGSATLYVAVCDPSGTQILLRKYVAENLDGAFASSGTTLGTFSGAVVATDVIRIEASGTTITVKQNGTIRISATDSSIASGRAGFATVTNGGGGVGNDFQWDSWSGGTILTSTRPRDLFLGRNIKMAGTLIDITAGAAARIGTTDAFNLILKRAGIDILTLDANSVNLAKDLSFLVGAAARAGTSDNFDFILRRNNVDFITLATSSVNFAKNITLATGAAARFGTSDAFDLILTRAGTDQLSFTATSVNLNAQDLVSVKGSNASWGTADNFDFTLRRNNVGMVTLIATEVQLAVDGSDIRWGKALVALGGGAAPTFGTIGGSGPATAAQNSWMKVIDSTGAAFWVPAWK